MKEKKQKSVSFFLRQCRENFVLTGALLPSSQALARAMTSEIGSCGHPRRILEVGPGTGVFTSEIAAKMGPSDHLDIYEINDAFADHLEERLLRDPVFHAVQRRVSLHRGDALHMPAEAIYDRIVSSLPLNNFGPEMVRDFLRTFMDHLTPGGVLSYFEYAFIRTLKQVVSSGAERERLREIGEVTEEFVRLYQVRSDPVFLNLPPAVARHLVRPVSLDAPARRAATSLRPAAAVQ